MSKHCKSCGSKKSNCSCPKEKVKKSCGCLINEVCNCAEKEPCGCPKGKCSCK